jgi:hypothetical protein
LLVSQVFIGAKGTAGLTPIEILALLSKSLFNCVIIKTTGGL